MKTCLSNFYFKGGVNPLPAFWGLGHDLKGITMTNTYFNSNTNSLWNPRFNKIIKVQVN